MHRSGTSLLGSLLRACGINTPGPLIPGDVHNPEGYAERADVTALQEQLLIDLERWWPSPRGMHPLPDGWMDSQPGQQALANLTALLQPEAQRQHGPWAIKDPRSSLLLPLWIATCPKLDIPLKLLLAVRDPAEVMVSLVQRDQAATGMDGWRAQRLWWHHNAQVLRDGRDLPLQVVSYSAWFDANRAHAQLRQLAPALSSEQLQQALQAIKPQHRRSRPHTLPMPLAAPVKALHRQLEQLARQPSRRADLEQWLAQQASPSALAPLPRRRSRFKRQLQSWRGQPPANQAAQHPWGYLAELCCGSQGPAPEHQLSYWLEHGFRRFELEQWAHLPGPCPPAEPWSCGPQPTAVAIRGGDLLHWGTHGWLQHCPIQGSPIQPIALAAGHGADVALNLSDLAPGVGCAHELLQLAQLRRVWDPNPARVRLLRQFGVRASWLRPCRPANGYLNSTAHTAEHWAAELGLAAPSALRQCGQTLCLGDGGPALTESLQPPLLGIPGFDGIAISTPEQAQLLAQWLQACLDAGLEIVRFHCSAAEQLLNSWSALHRQQPLWMMATPLSANELLEELEWSRQGCPPPEPCITPQPEVRVLSEHNHGICELAICISLHNYGHRIRDALTSVLNQQGSAPLELIVVDDASNDQGAAVVQGWLEQHHQHFGRCLLLQHTSNGGLASARNTAFAAAHSSWCFVLDADNQLDPWALAHCGKLARNADPRCAVIHSLVRVQPAEGCNDPRTLVSDQPWQREIVARGNYIDAMALVRRQAWHAIGGYTHIPGGWEDFDFWCSLIDAGWHGLLCPQVLATYNSHNTSMRAVSTTRQERRLSRVLQARHPWLQLRQTLDQRLLPSP